MRFLPLAAVLASGLIAGFCLPAAASADSIVYASDGNLFLISPDGAKSYQLTRDGGYSSPSQADDGTIGAAARAHGPRRPADRSPGRRDGLARLAAGHRRPV